MRGLCVGCRAGYSSAPPPSVSHPPHRLLAHSDFGAQKHCLMWWNGGEEEARVEEEEEERIPSEGGGGRGKADFAHPCVRV